MQSVVTSDQQRPALVLDPRMFRVQLLHGNKQRLEQQEHVSTLMLQKLITIWRKELPGKPKPRMFVKTFIFA